MLLRNIKTWRSNPTPQQRGSSLSNHTARTNQTHGVMKNTQDYIQLSFNSVQAYIYQITHQFDSMSIQFQFPITYSPNWSEKRTTWKSLKNCFKRRQSEEARLAKLVPTWPKVSSLPCRSRLEHLSPGEALPAMPPLHCVAIGPLRALPNSYGQAEESLVYGVETEY